LCFSTFTLFSTFSLKPESRPRPKLGRSTTLTWKKWTPNFSEICCGVLEKGAFDHIYNRRLDESVALDQDSPNQTYGPAGLTLDPARISRILLRLPPPTFDGCYVGLLGFARNVVCLSAAGLSRRNCKCVLIKFYENVGHEAQEKSHQIFLAIRLNGGLC